MRIYIAHSREFDFKNELYVPIRNDEELKEHEFILPHEISDVSSNTRDFYKDIDLLITKPEDIKGMMMWSLLRDIKDILLKPVEVFRLSSIDKESEFFKNIEKDGIKIYTKVY